ncbi:MAG: 2-C-methyl-D-erythritol 2,4-cyclodiphosphate synthase [Victivallaceae bacterium]|nr:2-C-methyl-D-erythritol 2,4-cyclodiphosphate synthase [Victivallaceae bacterium]
MMRIGNGFDVHAFSGGRKLILCGTEITPCDAGLAGHSDADVAVHALMDAILGALALGDIGMLFPDTDDAFLNADSIVLLKRILALDAVREWKLVNCDLTIIAQKPKLAPFRDAMRRRLADALNIGIDAVSVKFTTTEKLGFAGRGEGIAAAATVLLEK